MHPLQSHILKTLVLREKARYADLKPSGTESNRFVYHLKRLMTDGLVGKSAHEYVLTAPGKRYVGKLSLKSFVPRIQPKIVTVLIIQNAQGKYLVSDSHRQPFFGKVSFPYGKIHFGESLGEAAIRELKEKSGLTAPLRHCGDAYLSIRERGEIVSHMLCHVFYGKNPTGTLVPETKTHTNSWIDLAELPKSRYVPGFLELNELRKKGNRFFGELTV